MKNGGDVKGPGPLGCLFMALMLGYVLWQFAGCSKRDPGPVRASAPDNSAEIRDTLNSAALRGSAADLVRAEGYWCGSPTYLGPKSWTGQINPNMWELRLRCEGGGRTAFYLIVMDPDTKRGYVRRD